MALTLITNQGAAASIVLLAALGIASSIGFLVVERKQGAGAMMPLGMFASREYVALSLLTFFLYAALGELFLLVPYVLIETENFSATMAGAAFLPLILTIAALSPIAGALTVKYGAPCVMTIGCALVGLGFAVLAIGMFGSGYWATIFPAVVIVAVGMSAVIAPLTTAVLTSVDKEHVGAASGFNSAVARIGSLFATALLGSVFSVTGASLLGAYKIAMALGAIGCLIAANEATRVSSIAATPAPTPAE